MVRDNIAALFLLYARPLNAIGRILDHGRLWFAIGAAMCVSLLLHASDAGVRPATPATGMLEGALLRFLSYEPGSYVAPLGAVAIVLAPAILAVRAVSGFGSFGVLMRSDYLPLLLCMLTSWTAAYLPLAVLGVLGGAWLHTLPYYAAVNLYFVVLAALSVRTVFGTGFVPAVGMTALGWGLAVLGAGLFTILGPARYYLMSPLFIYYAYAIFGSDVRSIGEGLRSRQRLREQLEIATNNPRDADAHYQLGLIYQKRRQYTEALARFRRAVEIDPGEADAHLELGRIAREQGRFEQAIQHLQTASGLNDKLALNEVSRELGAACFGASRFEEAAAALEKYTARRPYDPEGLYWHGKTLGQLGRRADACEAFERCVEAVKTMPSHRRALVRKWGGQAQAELRALRRNGSVRQGKGS